MAGIRKSTPRNFGAEDRSIQKRLQRYMELYREFQSQGIPKEEATKLAYRQVRSEKIK